MAVDEQLRTAILGLDGLLEKAAGHSANKQSAPTSAKSDELD